MMSAEERAVGEQQPAKQKRGLMSRLRLPRRKSKSDKREGTPSPPPQTDTGRDPTIVTPDMPPRPKQRKSRVPELQEVKLDQAPTAREAAFGGPPRYDWIDIVSASKGDALCYGIHLLHQNQRDPPSILLIVDAQPLSSMTELS